MAALICETCSSMLHIQVYAGHALCISCSATVSKQNKGHSLPFCDYCQEEWATRDFAMAILCKGCSTGISHRMVRMKNASMSGSPLS